MSDILLEKRKIGNCEIKNPVMGAPLNMRPYGQVDGMATENHFRLYKEYGKSGLGIIISDAVNDSKECQIYRPALGCWEDSQIPGLRILAQNLQREHTRAILQLAHRGFPCLDVHALQEIPATHLLEVQKDFIAGAVRGKQAGFDGVELHACHAYLLSQILSPLTNYFDWKYSGTLEKRALYVTEIVEAIRRSCGENFIIGVRMGCNEPDLSSSIRLARLFEQAGVDYLSVSVGTGTRINIGCFDESFAWDEKIPDDFFYGKRLYGAWQIKQHVQIPVAGVGNIRTGEVARAILEKNYVDFIAIGRARLADPNWYHKIIAGEIPSYCFNCRTCLWFSEPQKCPARRRLNQQKSQ